MISTAGLRILDAVVDGRTVTPAELAERTSYSQQYLYDVLDQLVDAGVLDETRRRYNQRQVRTTSHPVVETYRQLTTVLGHVEWADLLSPATLRVCWYLDTSQRVTTIADRLGISRQAVHEALDPLKHRAMLSPSGPTYALVDDLDPLLAFSRAVVRHTHQQRLHEHAPSGTIAWCDPVRALIQVQTEADTDTLAATDDWELTGLARFADYDLQFFLADEPPFWYSPEPLDLAELVCHTLCIDSGSRRVSYVLLLLAATDVSQATLQERSQWYDLDEEIAAVWEYYTTGERPEQSPIQLPSPQEFESLKTQYDIQ